MWVSITEYKGGADAGDWVQPYQRHNVTLRAAGDGVYLDKCFALQECVFYLMQQQCSHDIVKAKLGIKHLNFRALLLKKKSVTR